MSAVWSSEEERRIGLETDTYRARGQTAELSDAQASGKRQNGERELHGAIIVEKTRQKQDFLTSKGEEERKLAVARRS